MLGLAEGKCNVSLGHAEIVAFAGSFMHKVKATTVFIRIYKEVTPAHSSLSSGENGRLLPETQKENSEEGGQGVRAEPGLKVRAREASIQTPSWAEPVQRSCK